MRNPITYVASKYGAPMGRAEYRDGAPTGKFGIRRVRLNQGGYDDGGAYWGIGQPLYWYCAESVSTEECGRCRYCNQDVRGAMNGDCSGTSDSEHVFDSRDVDGEVSAYVRADSRDHVKEIVLKKYPGAVFTR